jgi:hypothetical protein
MLEQSEILVTPASTAPGGREGRQAALATPATLVAPVQLAAAVAEEAAGRIILVAALPALREITLTMAMVVVVNLAVATETPAMLAGLVLPVALAMQALGLLVVALATPVALALLVMLVLLVMQAPGLLAAAHHQIHGLVRAGRLVMLEVLVLPELARPVVVQVLLTPEIPVLPGLPRRQTIIQPRKFTRSSKFQLLSVPVAVLAE